MSEYYDIFIKVNAKISAKQFADLIWTFFSDYLEIHWNSIEYDDNWIYLDASYDSDDEKEVFEFLEKSLICKLNYQAMQEEFDGEVVE